MSARLQVIYLVVRADGEIRVAKRPRVGTDEIAVRLNLTFPEGWGSVTNEINIEMPEPPVVEGQATDG